VTRYGLRVTAKSKVKAGYFDHYSYIVQEVLRTDDKIRCSGGGDS